MSLQTTIPQEFSARFGENPAHLVRAPGRVNLIGEHTDYNNGFVLPMAIDRAVWIALRPRTDDHVQIRSLDFSQSASFQLSRIKKAGEGWAEYVKGVAWALQDAGFALRGWEGVMGGDVPVGAGLSSSAALELAVARAFVSVSGLDWNPVQVAKLCQKTENEWVGVKTGIMDQMIAATGKSGHAVLIDCRSLEIRQVPLPPDVVIVVLDTNTRRGLVDSAYNERRAQCESAARHFGVPALRDVSVEAFHAQEHELDPVTARRARHVIMENARTLEAVNAMENGDPSRLGQLMNASHASLRDDFEVTNHELNVMVEIAQKQPGCYGARMTGAGFGGCAMALVAEELSGALVEQVALEYEQRTGLRPNTYICRAMDGAEEIY